MKSVRLSRTAGALTIVLSAGCGSQAGANAGLGSHPDGAVASRADDAATDATADRSFGDAGGDAITDAAVDTVAPARICTTNNYCVAVLDYRNGFSCWLPSAASNTDVTQDPCLIPWQLNPSCTTAAPPPVCPTTAPLPVQHSCPAVPCAIPSCNEGTCMVTIGFGSECPAVDAGSPDCAAR
ncbi:MAG: hypothetical protein ACREJ3_06330 [Polyangiaceae bacterium]